MTSALAGVRLPAREGHHAHGFVAHAHWTRMSASPTGTDGRPSPSRLDILLAARPGGDTDAVAEALRRRGYRLHMAGSTEAAVSVLENQPPHLVIAILPGRIHLRAPGGRRLTPRAGAAGAGGADSLVQGRWTRSAGLASTAPPPADDPPRLLLRWACCWARGRGGSQPGTSSGASRTSPRRWSWWPISGMKRVMTVARLMCQRTARGGRRASSSPASPA